MQYTLIMPNGKIMQFYVRATAETYKTLYGGVLIDNTILNSAEKVTV
jgi:hypothetical protein